MIRSPKNRLHIQLIGGPEGEGIEELIKGALVEAGFEVTLLNVDGLLGTKDSAALTSMLKKEADATVVLSAIRWNRLAGLVDPSMLPNGIALTSNRAASLMEEYQPKFALMRPLQLDEIKPVISAIGLLNAPIGGSWQRFEENAREFMGLHIGVQFHSGRVAGVPKVFDMVWKEGKIVGDAKYLTLVRGNRLPPAKFMEIAGHVWLLQATRANRRFLVFGNDRRVPEWWLRKYGELAKGVEFFFLGDYGKLEALN